MASVAATAVGTCIGIAGIVGIIDVIIKKCLHVKRFLQASKRVADAIGRIVAFAKT
jgi:hypothetical protein